MTSFTSLNPSKLGLQAINKFHYYYNEIIHHLFPSDSLDYPQTRTCEDNGITYVYHTSQTKGEFKFNNNSVIEAVKGSYLAIRNEADQIFKVRLNTYSKKQSFPTTFGGSQNIAELLEIAISDQPHPKNTNKSNYHVVYIIHHRIDEDQAALKWINFVQEITFTETEISHVMIGTILGKKKIINWGCSIRQFERFIQSYCLLDTIQGYILQFSNEIITANSMNSDPAYHNSHKIVNKIPKEFIKILHQLKQQFGEEEQITICRFMIARDFKYEESRLSIGEYLKWKNQITEKYNWEDFSDIHSRGIFSYIGEDDMGRPIVLNRSNRLNINQIDLDKYCDYFLYFLEIFIPSKMRGHVYQMFIIGDTSNQTSDNYKLSITKRNLIDALKYCSERQYRLISVNTDNLTYYIYRLIKHLIPKKSQNKILAVGTEKKEIKNTLNQYMNDSVIPAYLGGDNIEFI